eukprot:3139009-Rhodomonas_salina.2
MRKLVSPRSESLALTLCPPWHRTCPTDLRATKVLSWESTQRQVEGMKRTFAEAQTGAHEKEKDLKHMRSRLGQLYR